MSRYSQTEIVDADGNHVPIDVYAPADEAVTGQPLTRVVFLHGANCAAERYAWLGEGLAAAGCLVLVPTAPVLEEAHPLDPGKTMVRQFATHDQFRRVLALLDEAGDRFSYDMWLSPELIVGGHSAGAGIVLEQLIPGELQRNPASGWTPDFTPPAVSGAFVFGSHLQAEAMGRTVAWRSNERPLENVTGAPILLLAGERDGMATPEKVHATWERLSEPAFYACLSGANHFGWTEGLGRHDRVDLDLRATLTPAEQQQRTLAYVTAFIRGIRFGKPEVGFGAMAGDAHTWGDDVAARVARSSVQADA